MKSISKLLTDAIIRMLISLGRMGRQYPKKLLDNRREEFKKQIDKHNKGAE